MSTPLQDLDHSLARLTALVAQLAPEIADAPGIDGTWSIAGIVEHLAVTERGMNLRLRKSLSSPPADADALTATYGKDDIIAQRVAVRVSTIEAPEAVRPQDRYGKWPGPWTALQEARAQNVDLITKESERLATLIFPHPALGPLHGLQWMRFFAAHMLRHCDQIEAMLAKS